MSRSGRRRRACEAADMPAASPPMTRRRSAMARSVGGTPAPPALGCFAAGPLGPRPRWPPPPTLRAMAETDTLRERLETMLKEHLGVDELVTDAEGDYPVRAGSAKYYVRLDDDKDPA